MSHLKTGKYSPKTEHQVTYWPAPDKEGDGDVIWNERKDEYGNSLGRVQVRDDQGNEVRGYSAPDGFENRPGFDHTDNYVKVDDKKRVVRDSRGNALQIKPGSALVEYADGTSQLLEDEYSQYQWAQKHNVTDALESNTSGGSSSTDSNKSAGTKGTGSK